MSLAIAYADSPATAQCLYRLIGAVHPGPDLTLPAAAALADIPRDEAGRALENLAGARLLRVEARPNELARYRLADDAVRAHARQVGLDESDTDRGEALRRLTN